MRLTFQLLQLRHNSIKEVVGVAHDAERLVGAPVHQFLNDRFRLVNDDSIHRLDRTVALDEGGKHVAGRDGVKHSSEHNHEGCALSEETHLVLSLDHIGYYARERAI